MSMINSMPNDNVQDGGWHDANSRVQYRKIDDVVWVKIHDYTITSSWSTIGTLPEGYRPSVNVNISLYSNSSNLVIETDGDVMVTGQYANPTIISFVLG